jgi:predicted RNA-binding Zn ribbon-like protein
MRLSDVLDSEKKWMKGSGPANANGCLLTSAWIAYGRDECVRAMPVLGEVVSQLFPERVAGEVNLTCAVTAFNDHCETTFADVQKVVSEFERRWEDG